MLDDDDRRVVRSTMWARYRTIARNSNALLIRGLIQPGDGGVVSLQADHLEPLDLNVAHTSRDFR